MRRLALVWLVLFAAYAATSVIDAVPGHELSAREAHVLLTAESIVSDGDVDLRNQYRERSGAGWDAPALRPRGQLTSGRLDEPQGIGLPLLVAPGYALGGPRLAELELAALAALAFALAVALARRLVPEPWATAAPMVCGLSAPVLAGAGSVAPDLAAGAALAGAALLALRARERPRLRYCLGAGALAGALPWLGPTFLAPALVVVALLARWLWNRGRRFAALVACEATFTSLVVYAALNDRLFGGLTPDAAALTGSTQADLGAHGVDRRLSRLVGLWLDGDAGLLRWAPVFALAGFTAWLLWRSRRDRLARALPGRGEMEVAAVLLLAATAAQVLVAALLSPTLSGAWLGPRHLLAVLPLAGALAAWGLRHAPRAGGALCAASLVASAWLVAGLAIDGRPWSAPGDAAPWGPLSPVFPRFGVGSAYAHAVTAIVAGALATLLLVEWRLRVRMTHAHEAERV